MWTERDRCCRGHVSLRKVDRVRVHRREQVQAPQDQAITFGAHPGQAKGQAQPSRNQRGRPTGQARVHAMTLREGRTSLEVVTATLYVFGYPVPTLLDPGATYYFISYRLATLAPIPTSPIPEMWRV